MDTNRQNTVIAKFTYSLGGSGFAKSPFATVTAVPLLALPFGWAVLGFLLPKSFLCLSISSRSVAICSCFLEKNIKEIF